MRLYSENISKNLRQIKALDKNQAFNLSMLDNTYCFVAWTCLSKCHFSIHDNLGFLRKQAELQQTYRLIFASLTKLVSMAFPLENGRKGPEKPWARDRSLTYAWGFSFSDHAINTTFLNFERAKQIQLPVKIWPRYFNIAEKLEIMGFLHLGAGKTKCI